MKRILIALLTLILAAAFVLSCNTTEENAEDVTVAEDTLADLIEGDVPPDGRNRRDCRSPGHRPHRRHPSGRDAHPGGRDPGRAHPNGRRWGCASDVRQPGGNAHPGGRTPRGRIQLAHQFVQLTPQILHG